MLALAERLTVSVWNGLENSPAYPTEVALFELLAGRRAADAVRAPFVLGDREELAALLESAAVASTSITTQTDTARYPSMRTMVEAESRGWLPVMGVVLAEQQIQRILAEADTDLRPYTDGEGEVAFDSPARIISSSER